MGIPIARVELIDRYAVQAVNRHDKLTLTEAPMLLMEFHGRQASVAGQAATVQQTASGHGGRGLLGRAEATGGRRAEGGRRAVVDLNPGAAFPKPVTLSTSKTDAVLRSTELVRNSRLSVMPLTEAQYKRLLELAGA